MTSPSDKISKYFTLKDALWLPSWNVFHLPSKEEMATILTFAQVMDTLRDHLNHPIIVHVWLRPILNNPASPHHGEDYNAFVGGAKASAHKQGCAVDYHVQDVSTDSVKALLLPLLDQFNIRMEDNGKNSSWIHNDSLAPHPHRFFIP